jgi:hypothetical protein
MINEVAERKNSTIHYQQRLEPGEVTFADSEVSNGCIKQYAVSIQMDFLLHRLEEYFPHMGKSGRPLLQWSNLTDFQDVSGEKGFPVRLPFPFGRYVHSLHLCSTT